MSEIHSTVTIDAPVERIVALLNSPENLASWVPHVARVVDVKRIAQPAGTTFDVICKTHGVSFEESLVVSRFELPPRTTPHRPYQIWWSFKGVAQGSCIWTLEALDDQTEAGVDIEYRLTGGLIGRAVEWLLVRSATEKRTGQMLRNMKRELAGRSVLTGA